MILVRRLIKPPELPRHDQRIRDLVHLQRAPERLAVEPGILRKAAVRLLLNAEQKFQRTLSRRPVADRHIGSKNLIEIARPDQMITADVVLIGIRPAAPRNGQARDIGTASCLVLKSLELHRSHVELCLIFCIYSREFFDELAPTGIIFRLCRCKSLFQRSRCRAGGSQNVVFGVFGKAQHGREPPRIVDPCHLCDISVGGRAKGLLDLAELAQLLHPVADSVKSVVQLVDVGRKDKGACIGTIRRPDPAIDRLRSDRFGFRSRIRALAFEGRLHLRQRRKALVAHPGIAQRRVVVNVQFQCPVAGLKLDVDEDRVVLNVGHIGFGDRPFAGPRPIDLRKRQRIGPHDLDLVHGVILFGLDFFRSGVNDDKLKQVNVGDGHIRVIGLGEDALGEREPNFRPRVGRRADGLFAGGRPLSVPARAARRERLSRV